MKQPESASATRITRRRRWTVFSALLPLCCFALLSQAVWKGKGFDWDTPVLQSVHRFSNPDRDNLMVFVTNTGDVRIVLILGMIYALGLVARQRRKDARFLARCIVGTAFLGILAKSAFHRVRPHLWVSPAPESDFGFPSGHTMDSLSLAFALVAISWRMRWRWPVVFIGGFYVLSVGFSRLYLGVHYPSDVLGGWALALAWLIALSGWYSPSAHDSIEAT